MGKHPNEKYMRLRAIADTETTKKIKLTTENEKVKEYYEKLKELQQEAKQKGLSRG